MPTPNTIKGKLLTVDGAAELLSVSRTTVYALLKSGQLPSCKLGASRRIPATAVQQFAARAMAEAR